MGRETTADRPLRVLVADDYPFFRRTLRQLIESDLTLQWVGEAHDGVEVIKMARGLSPEVILMDISLPGINGLDAIDVIRDRQPHTVFVVLLDEEHHEYRAAAARVGAHGCLAKTALQDELLPRLRAIRGDLHRGRNPGGADDR